MLYCVLSEKSDQKLWSLSINCLNYNFIYVSEFKNLINVINSYLHMFVFCKTMQVSPIAKIKKVRCMFIWWFPTNPDLWYNGESVKDTEKHLRNRKYIAALYTTVNAWTALPYLTTEKNVRIFHHHSTLL